MAAIIKPERLRERSAEIDRRLGPISGREADRIAAELQNGAREIERMQTAGAELLTALKGVRGYAQSFVDHWAEDCDPCAKGDLVRATKELEAADAAIAKAEGWANGRHS